MLSLLLLLGCRPDPVEQTLLVPGPATNLLVISIDTLRRDALTRYGGTGDMPFLDSWFDQAVALDDHLSCSNWTYSSMLCALTGTTQLEAGFLPLNGQGPQPWPAPVPLLAEELQDAGFLTGLVSGSRFLSHEVGTASGYDEDLVDPGAPASALVPAALDFLETVTEQQRQRWFLHLHVVDPHSPYDPPLTVLPEWTGPGALNWDLRDSKDFMAMRKAWPDLDEQTRSEVQRQVRLLYAGELRQLDRDLEDLWTQAQNLGALEDTLVVFFSDHGEQFAEHGHWSHGATLHAEEIEAIAGFSAPDLGPMSVPLPTWHVDLAPSILQALGQPVPEAATGEAVGLGSVDRIRTALRFDRSLSPRQLLAEGEWRLHYNWNGNEALYDRSNDPTETSDQSQDAVLDAARLWVNLTPYVADLEDLQDQYVPEPSQ